MKPAGLFMCLLRRRVLAILATSLATIAAMLDAQPVHAQPNTLYTTQFDIPRVGWHVDADSDQSPNGSTWNAIDGDPATFWHSQYAPAATPLPHAITIQLRDSTPVTGLRYRPRNDGSSNGNIGKYQVHVSTDGVTWGDPAAVGTFADDAVEKSVAFNAVKAKYVRLTALTEAGNRGPWTSAAEISLTYYPVLTIPRGGWTIATDSQQTQAGLAGNAIDGSLATGWHTQYAPTASPLPHTFTIDMHATNLVSSLRYQPRTDGSFNGNIGQYQIHVSVDGTNWGNPITTGTFLDDATEKAAFFAPASARYVRLTALTEAGNRGPWTSAAEINLANNPLSATQCTPLAPIYATRSSGAFFQYQHLKPENGGSSFAAAGQINSGFATDARRVAGPNGFIYSAVNNGERRRRRWNGTSWDTFAGGAQYEVIDTNPLWARYSTADYFNRITVDSVGDIYTVEPDGGLHWRRYDPVARIWAHRIVQTGSPDWSPRRIVAAGPGVVYESSSTNRYMWRLEYHPESQRSRTWAVGDGWDAFGQLFSPGGDILYGIRSDTGDLMWFRFDPDTESIANGRVNDVPIPLRLGSGWPGNTEVTAAPDSCQRTGVPWRPAVPEVAPKPMAPVTLLAAANGHLHYSYVDDDGRAVHADARDLTGPVRLAAVPGMIGLNGTLAIAESVAGRVQIVGTGLDAVVRTNTETIAGGAWGQADALGGFFSTVPAIVTVQNNVLVVHSVDQDGARWTRQLMCGGNPNYPWYPRDPWQRVRFFDDNAPPIDNQRPLVAMPTGSNDARLVAQDANGTIYAKLDSSLAFTDECTGQSMAKSGAAVPDSDGPVDLAWHSLGGAGFLIGPHSVVSMPETTLQVVATGSNGVVYTQRETADGFPGTWTAVSGGITAGGPASATLAPDGKIKILVRGTDGIIYYTSQPAPNATTFDPWQAIPGTDETGTDPTAMAVPGLNTWVVAYRTDLNVPRLRKYVPGALVASSSFVDVPMTPPA